MQCSPVNCFGSSSKNMTGFFWSDSRTRNWGNIWSVFRLDNKFLRRPMRGGKNIQTAFVKGKYKSFFTWSYSVCYILTCFVLFWKIYLKHSLYGFSLVIWFLLSQNISLRIIINLSINAYIILCHLPPNCHAYELWVD